MAPGRKRGASKAKAKSLLSVGDLVLAKVKGFPAWPAKISRPEDWDRTPDPKKYFVQFFGTEEIAFVAPAEIQEFNNEVKNKLSARCQGKTVKHFAQAVKEICEAFEQSQCKTSSECRVDADESPKRCDVSSVDGLAGDKVQSGPKEVVERGRPSAESASEDLDEGIGLERDSTEECETKSRDVKPDKLSNVKDSSQGASVKKKNKVLNGGAKLPNAKDGAYDKKHHDLENFGGKKRTLANGHKSNSAGPVLKNNCDGASEIKQGRSQLAASESDKRPDDVNHPESGEHAKNATGFGVASGDNPGKISSDVVMSELDVSVKQRTKKLIKPKKQTEGANVLRGRVVSSGEQVKDEISERKRRARLSDGKRDLAVDETSVFSKKLKTETLLKDRKNSSLSSVVRNNKTDKRIESRTSASRLKDEGHSTSRVESSTNGDVGSDEAVLPLSKRRRKARDAMSDSTAKISEKLTESKSVIAKNDVSSSHVVRHSATHSRVKRRAVCIDDDDDDDPKTPVHGGSAASVVVASKKVSDSIDQKKRTADSIDQKQKVADSIDQKKKIADSIDQKKKVVDSIDLKKKVADSVDQRKKIADSAKNFDAHNGGVRSDLSNVKDSCKSEDSPALDECVASAKSLDGNDTLSPSLQEGSDKGPHKTLATNASQSPRELEFEKLNPMDAKAHSVSPEKLPVSIAPVKPVAEQHKIAKPGGKLSTSGSQRKPISGSSKGSVVASSSVNTTQNQMLIQKNKPNASVERMRSTPRFNARPNSDAVLADSIVENNLLVRERLEDDSAILLVDSKTSDSVMSMKHLIAVAQAKRKQSQSQSSAHSNFNSILASTTDIQGRSPSPASLVHPFVSSISNLIQADAQGNYSRATTGDSPLPHGHQSASRNQLDLEGIEERRVSSGHNVAGGSLSGGTEAAVARDAFEGMIETLSRTKESIGRATRLAIDCAKYGIANEVVELLIRKLESEPSFHRKVDLFFLVDSITQCSHTQKGIAGASYIPTVQAALPRLLGAAAPPGNGARENRRQCLKVLRLWLERKILPESLLRSSMDDIGGSGDDFSTGPFHRRLSRAERAVDDPIREMEGMLVDEYGSNATFQLPGFLSCNVFEEDEEYNFPNGEAGDASVVDPEPFQAQGKLETCSSTPSDRRHCILEDVDGELEMEDVSGHPKEEKSVLVKAASVVDLQTPDCGRVVESDLTLSMDVLPLLEGSPPLPLESPPMLPPLPDSPPPPDTPPPPPPPPPLSPSPPPPPPPPSQPPLPPLPPSGPPPALFSQTPLPHQPLMPHPLPLPSTSPNLLYQPPAPNEYCGTSGGNQGNKLGHMAGNTSHVAHIDNAVKNDMFPQHSTSFVPTVVHNSREPSGYSSKPLEYGHADTYTNHQTSHNQQFQLGSAPFVQRPFQPIPPPPNPSNHFSYPKPMTQQHQQHQQLPYAHPYSLPTLPDGQRRYCADEKWRMPSNETSGDNQRPMWMGGGRAPCVGPPFPQEGCFRPPVERPLGGNMCFQPAMPNSLPTGAPLPGHGVPQMLPSRPDIHALNCWRPA